MKNIYHFLHIGKTGGCAVIHALNPYRGGNGGPLRLHEHPTTMKDCPSDEYIFMNVRHPEKRFLSAFYYVKRHHWPREVNPVAWNPAEEKFFKRFNTANEALEGLTAPDQTTRDIAKNGLKHGWHMRDKQVRWVGGMDYLKANIHRVFHVNFNETLVEDFDRLVKKLDLPEDIMLPTDERIANISKNDEDDKELSELARINLIKHYIKDYDMYNFLMTLKQQGQV